MDEIEVKSMLWMFLFIICMIGVFGKLLLFGVQMAWGISKFLLTIVILPLILIGMVVGGLLYIAFPILIVIGIIALLFLSRGFERKVFLLNCICGILTDKYVIMKKRRGSAVHEKQSEDFH